jgi:hypothetical protein
VGSLDLEDRPFRASQPKTEKTKNIMTVVDTACIEEKKGVQKRIFRRRELNPGLVGALG